MFAAQNISYRIGRHEILSDCSFALTPGVFTVLVGANGAGKTSLLKIAANEVQKFSGKVMLHGTSTTKLNSRELSKLRAVLPQHTTVNFPFSVEQVIAIGRYPHLTTKIQNDRIIEEVMTVTNLFSFKERTYQTLSGGEQQRVQLGRVLAQTWDDTLFPKYLLLDEPTASLDVAQQHIIMQLARQALSRNMGVLAIIHDLNLAIQYADELIFLKEGKIIAHGKTENILTKEIIEQTFSHPVQLLDTGYGRPMVCALPANHDQSDSKINSFTKNNTSYEQLAYH
jgi:iron complex transport system ATP-binding protein